MGGAASRDTSRDKPHGGSGAPQERRRCSNFKYVLTRNQKLLTIMGGENPHFPCDHLLDPKVNEAEILTRRNILFALSLTFFSLPPSPADLGMVSHFEISFHSKIEALISPHLRSMKSHK